MTTNTGTDVCALSEEAPVMLVFLRHFGCTFCREALADLAKKRQHIEATGTRLVLVHMSDEQTAQKYFKRYHLTDIIHSSDPVCRFYTAFGLIKGNFNQLFGLRNWIRGFQAGILDGHGIGMQLGDGFQMPGVFIVQEGNVVASFIHEVAADRPDYTGLLDGCCALSSRKNIISDVA